jgi:hypothetical protein
MDVARVVDPPTGSLANNDETVIDNTRSASNTSLPTWPGACRRGSPGGHGDDVRYERGEHEPGPGGGVAHEDQAGADEVGGMVDEPMRSRRPARTRARRLCRGREAPCRALLRYPRCPHPALGLGSPARGGEGAPGRPGLPSARVRQRTPLRGSRGPPPSSSGDERDAHSPGQRVSEQRSVLFESPWGHSVTTQHHSTSVRLPARLPQLSPDCSSARMRRAAPLPRGLSRARDGPAGAHDYSMLFG